MVEHAKKIFLGYSNNDTNDDYRFKYEPPKNFDYWFSNKRNFKISRGFYPYYTDGYLWGRYENENLTKWYEKQENQEKDTKSRTINKDCITREF